MEAPFFGNIPESTRFGPGSLSEGSGLGIPTIFDVEGGTELKQNSGPGCTFGRLAHSVTMITKILGEWDME